MSKEKINDCHLALVTKCQFDYWYEKGTLGEAVKLQGDVAVLVEKRDFKEYLKTQHPPTKMLEIAIYENLEELKGVFNG